MVIGLAARGELRPNEQRLLRAVLVGAGGLLTAVGVLALADLAGEPEHSLEDAASGYVVFAALAAGAMSFTGGAAWWSGRPAFWLRLGGWILVMGALAVPTTLTLGLPLAATLAVGLQRIDSSPRSPRASDRTGAPRSSTG